ncbi:hypothetical protein BKA69DRAFT_61958 [Paraphysoderma sedebokerense]|nr:hypothetical protein BKA69DRAFT_61958 [Paraphysoderma sedebokerense]
MVKLQDESLNVPAWFRTKTEMCDWFIKSLYESFRLLPNVTEFQVTTKTYRLSECPRWFRFLPTPSNSHQFPAIEEKFDRDLNLTFPPVIHSTAIGSDITAYSSNVLDRFGIKLHSSHCKCSTLCNQQRLVKCFALGCDEEINGCWDCATKFDPYRPFAHVVCSKHFISADFVDSRCGRCFVEMAVLTCGQSNHALRPTPWYCHDCAKDMLRTCDYCKDNQICHYCDVEGSGWDRWGDYSVCPACKNRQQIA